MAISPNFEQIDIISTSNGKVVKADILQKSDKFLKVALAGTNLTLSLHRDNMNKKYVGHMSGLEFYSTGEVNG